MIEKGQHLVEAQKENLLSFVEEQRLSGRPVYKILENMKISKSSYYRWVKEFQDKKMGIVFTKSKHRQTMRSVTDEELLKIDEVKEKNPHLRHRQIQGLMQLEGNFISTSVVYHRLKANGKVEHYERREAVWKEARYEVIKANIMWGADWTQLRIGGSRWYLLTLIDFFSRLIIHCEIVPTVNSSHIKNLYQIGLDSINVPISCEFKPELRLDQGSPNTSRITKEFFKDIKSALSYARVRRPTDNARTERFYRTIKQEEIYLVGDYQDPITAKEEIGNYIKWYNEKRPHQALWNFTPWLVHETNNKTYMVEVLKKLKRKKWEERREYWMDKKKKQIDKKINNDKNLNS